MSNLINFFQELYVGQKRQKGEPLPLAFLTPYENNAAGRKRMETVDTWSANTGSTRQPDGTWKPNPKDFESKIIHNEPLSGFAIAKSVRRSSSWNGGNVVWRVEDPRGFEWEISSANLAQIITQTGISAGGSINGRCVIGRLAGANILVPEGTDLWDQMNEDMAKRKVKATQKNLTGYQIGDIIKIKSGAEFVYLGKERVMLKVYDDPNWNTNRYRYGSNQSFKLKESVHDYFLFAQVDDYNIREGYFPVYAYKNNPVVEVLTTKIDAKILHTIRNNPVNKTYLSFSGNPKEASTEIHGFI